MSERVMLRPGHLIEAPGLCPMGAMRMECLRFAKGNLSDAKDLWAWVNVGDMGVGLTQPGPGPVGISERAYVKGVSHE